MELSILTVNQCLLSWTANINIWTALPGTVQTKTVLELGSFIFVHCGSLIWKNLNIQKNVLSQGDSYTAVYY